MLSEINKDYEKLLVQGSHIDPKQQPQIASVEKTDY